MKMEKPNRPLRHGDVLLVPVGTIPTEAKKLDHLILAEGEVTGHSHQISKGKATLFSYNEKTYLNIQDELACLTHEEHKEIKLPKGNFEVIIQKEYSPEGWVRVQD